MNAIELLLGRNSAPRLVEPAPSATELETMYQAALRAPDHARLRPWRFLSITGQAREPLGEVFVEALQKRNPDVTTADKDKARLQPFRAPHITVVIARQIEHPKVPCSEQLLSAGCAAHGLLLAAQALGFAGVWRTGDNAFDKHVMSRLGLDKNENIIGFMYIGTINGSFKPLPILPVEDFVQQWPLPS